MAVTSAVSPKQECEGCGVPGGDRCRIPVIEAECRRTTEVCADEDAADVLHSCFDTSLSM